MVMVRLLKDIAEGGTEWASDGPRNAAGQRPAIKTTRGKNPDFVKGGSQPKHITIQLCAGTVISMHEASAEKWVARGLCEVI